MLYKGQIKLRIFGYFAALWQTARGQLQVQDLMVWNPSCRQQDARRCGN